MSDGLFPSAAVWQRRRWLKRAETGIAVMEAVVMATNIGRNMRHLLDFMAKYPDGRRFSFAYRDRATVNAVKALERRGMIKVDWVTKQIVYPEATSSRAAHLLTNVE